jgi:hypothetical protein
MLSTSVSLEEMRFLGPNHPLNQKAFKFSIGDLHDFDSLHELVLKESHETNCNRWKKEKENSRRQHGNRPLTIAFTSGLVWPNIQANERAIIAMKVQNNASSFLTPKFSKKRNKNLHDIKTSPSEHLEISKATYRFIVSSSLHVACFTHGYNLGLLMFNACGPIHRKGSNLVHTCKTG